MLGFGFCYLFILLGFNLFRFFRFFYEGWFRGVLFNSRNLLIRRFGFFRRFFHFLGGWFFWSFFYRGFFCSWFRRWG